jgi:hypothetical protein
MQGGGTISTEIFSPQPTADSLGPTIGISNLFKKADQVFGAACDP